MKLAAYTLGTFFLTMLLFNCGLIFFPEFQNKKNFQSWWQENYAKIQGYVYSSEKYSIVFAGTSMSASIDAKLFSKNTYNLGLVGSSSLTGLEIIKRNNKLPEIVIIETNWIERGVYENMVEFAFTPVISELRKMLPGLHEANQPVNILGNILMAAQPDSRQNITKVDSNFFRSRLAENVASHNSESDTMMLQKSVRLVNTYVDFFSQNGVKVYLIEIPVHPLIESSKKYQCIRKTIAKIIDSKKYTYIPKYPDNHEIQTSDGYHLTKESLYRYTLFLSEILK
jgi:hypothetical protein